MNDVLVTLRTALSLAAVLALLGGFVWLLKRGSIKLSGFAPQSTIAIETATALGDRRQLAIITVEGRRVLVGMTPTTISFITELGKKSPEAGPA
ncbi:MAG: flagellar biosynthetic protein FliO [Vicinamibacterales bacterium]